jgi:hypothetical protein
MDFGEKLGQGWSRALQPLKMVKILKSLDYAAFLAEAADIVNSAD